MKQRLALRFISTSWNMAKKAKKMAATLLEGASSGLSGEALFGFVLKRHPKITDKKLIRSSMAIVRDPSVVDRSVLNAVSSLAINHKVQNAVLNPAG